MASGEATGVDRDDVVRFGIAAAVAVGHNPADVREWALTDLLAFVTYVQATAASHGDTS